MRAFGRTCRWPVHRRQGPPGRAPRPAGGDLDPVPGGGHHARLRLRARSRSGRLAAAGPGLLWLAVILSGVLALGRLHHLETEDGAFELLGLYPISRAAIYLGKALGGLVAMLALGALVLPLTVILFAVDVDGGRPRPDARHRSRVGFAAVGTLYAG